MNNTIIRTSSSKLRLFMNYRIGDVIKIINSCQGKEIGVNQKNNKIIFNPFFMKKY